MLQQASRFQVLSVHFFLDLGRLGIKLLYTPKKVA